MNNVKKIFCIALLLIPFIANALTKEVPFTLDYRDRMIRTEQKLESIDTKLDTKFDSLRVEMNARFVGVDKQFVSVNQQFEAVDKRFDAMDKRFDQLFNFLWAIIGIFTTMVVSVIGFAFWDRKLSLAPMKNENAKMLNVLREYAEHQPKLREILRNAGLL